MTEPQVAEPQVTEPQVIELSEWESKQRLGGVPTPREVLTTTVEEAVDACESLGGRVVCKASGVAHKFELGLVRIGLDAAAVRSNWEELAAGGDGTVLCSELVSGELELIVGGLRDPHFGPVVSIGIGGVAAEVFGDVAVVLAPPEPGELDAALATLRGDALLRGHRGSVPVDVAALEQIVMAVSNLLEDDPSVVEVDCNPVLVSDGKPLVLDALVVRTAR